MHLGRMNGINTIKAHDTGDGTRDTEKAEGRWKTASLGRRTFVGHRAWGTIKTEVRGLRSELGSFILLS